LLGLKWTDVNFKNNEIGITRSIVMQVVGSCKTEASQKPVPLDPLLARTLHTWRVHTKYKAAGDWVGEQDSQNSAHVQAINSS
jgi:integrase